MHRLKLNGLCATCLALLYPAHHLDLAEPGAKAPRLKKFRFFAFALLFLLLLGGCRSGPIEPTLAPRVTDTLTPEPTGPLVTVSPSPLPTLPPTWTPKPSQTALPSQPPQPTAPPAPTRDRTAEAPIGVISNGNGASVITITEAQLNAALKRKFDDAPLPNYPSVPHATLSDGALVLTLYIVPQNAPADSSPQTMTLIANLAIYGGALELDPIDLSPLDVGVTTRQVKLAHKLLMQTLDEISRQAAGDPANMTYNYSSIEAGKLLLTVVGQ